MIANIVIFCMQAVSMGNKCLRRRRCSRPSKQGSSFDSRPSEGGTLLPYGDEEYGCSFGECRLVYMHDTIVDSNSVCT